MVSFSVFKVNWARSGRPPLGAAGGAAVLALFVIVSGLIGGDTKDPPIVVPVPRPAGLAQEGHVLGAPGAPVTITEYADFQ